MQIINIYSPSGKRFYIEAVSTYYDQLRDDNKNIFVVDEKELLPEYVNYLLQHIDNRLSAPGIISTLELYFQHVPYSKVEAKDIAQSYFYHFISNEPLG